MKKIISLITATAAALTLFSAALTGSAAETYKDVPPTHWAYNAVERCSASKWFSGYPDGTFRPDGEITRAEAIKVFVTFLGEPLPENLTSTSYYDVEIDDWYAPYIEAGKDLFPPRTSMTSQPKFQPDMPVTREDTVYALVNALNYDQLVKNADESVLNMFSDQNSISEICRAHMAVAVSNELVSGYDNGTIGAQDPLTRAQFATLLYRATYVGSLEETEKKLVKVDIEPDTLSEVKVGDVVEFKAAATYSDGSTEDYTSQLNPYTDDAEGVVTINKNKVTAVGAGTVIIKFNNETVSDKQVVMVVSPAPTPEPTLEPTLEPTAEPAEAEPAEETKAVSIEDLEYEVFDLVNEERAANGVEELAWADDLAAIAREHSEDMAERGFFDHTNPDGLSPFDRIKNYGIDYSSAAENIAYGSSTAEDVMALWMDSEGHRANILDENLSEIGVGAAVSPDGVIYWTQVFVTR